MGLCLLLDQIGVSLQGDWNCEIGSYPLLYQVSQFNMSMLMKCLIFRDVQNCVEAKPLDKFGDLTFCIPLVQVSTAWCWYFITCRWTSNGDP